MAATPRGRSKSPAPPRGDSGSRPVTRLTAAKQSSLPLSAEAKTLWRFLLVWVLLGAVVVPFIVRSPPAGGLSRSAKQCRDVVLSPANFQWTFLAGLGSVMHLYAVDVDQRNWGRVCAALAFFGMDLFNEVMNTVVMYTTNYAPLWGTPGHKSAFVVLPGLNVEIMFFFMAAGLMVCRLLPRNKNLKFFGVLPNRWTLAVVLGWFGVLVEVFLNWCGALTWDWPLWSTASPVPIFFWGYFQFAVVSFHVHDMPQTDRVRTLAGIYGVVAALVLEFGWRRGILWG